MRYTVSLLSYLEDKYGFGPGFTLLVTQPAKKVSSITSSIASSFQFLRTFRYLSGFLGRIEHAHSSSCEASENGTTVSHSMLKQPSSSLTNSFNSWMFILALLRQCKAHLTRKQQ